MANTTSAKLDNMEVQQQPQNNNPRWENADPHQPWDETTATAKLFECSRIKALAGTSLVGWVVCPRNLVCSGLAGTMEGVELACGPTLEGRGCSSQLAPVEGDCSSSREMSTLWQCLHSLFSSPRSHEEAIPFPPPPPPPEPIGGSDNVLWAGNDTAVMVCSNTHTCCALK